MSFFFSNFFSISFRYLKIFAGQLDPEGFIEQSHSHLILEEMGKQKKKLKKVFQFFALKLLGKEADLGKADELYESGDSTEELIMSERITLRSLIVMLKMARFFRGENLVTVDDVALICVNIASKRLEKVPSTLPYSLPSSLADMEKEPDIAHSFPHVELSYGDFTHTLVALTAMRYPSPYVPLSVRLSMFLTSNFFFYLWPACKFSTKSLSTL